MATNRPIETIALSYSMVFLANLQLELNRLKKKQTKKKFLTTKMIPSYWWLAEPFINSNVKVKDYSAFKSSFA